jgi:hypothetical protein
MDQPLTLEHDIVDVQIQVLDDDELLLDPWFWKSEEEFAAIEDDPTAKIVEIKIAPLADHGTGLEDKRWAF